MFVLLTCNNCSEAISTLVNSKMCNNNITCDCLKCAGPLIVAHFQSLSFAKTLRTSCVNWLIWTPHWENKNIVQCTRKTENAIFPFSVLILSIYGITYDSVVWLLSLYVILLVYTYFLFSFDFFLGKYGWEIVNVVVFSFKIIIILWYKLKIEISSKKVTNITINQ